MAGFVLFRRRSRKWKVKLDAEAFLKFRSRMQSHAKRTIWLERIRRGLMGLPSLLAAFVLFFVPVASHIVFSARQLTLHYRFSVPVNWMIVKSFDAGMTSVFFNNEGALRYGITPLWLRRSFRSGATFGWSDPKTPYPWWRPLRERGGKRTEVASSKFRIGKLEMECWEYATPYRDPEPLTEVLCETRPNGVDFNLHAAFLGHEEDKQSFYAVVRSAVPEGVN